MNRRQQIFVLGLVLLVTVAIGATYIYMEPSKDTGKIQVVASFYPLAYFSGEIGGDYVQVLSLIPFGAEAHTWQPSTSAILEASRADILVYSGAGIDNWFEEDIVPVINVTGKTIVKTTKNLTLIANQDIDDDEGPPAQFDTHTWLSPYMAKQEAQKIFDALVARDPSHANYYTERWNSLKLKFESLDYAFMTGLANKTKTTIFVTHAAFGYLADRYNFTQEAVIGESADEEPSATAIAELVNKMIEQGIYYVYLDPFYPDSYAQTIKSELVSKTGQNVQLLTLSHITGPIDGKNYFEQLQDNLNNLKIGLGVS